MNAIRFMTSTPPTRPPSSALGEVMEHSAWVAEGTFAKRPFASLAALYQAMTDTVRGADHGRRLGDQGPPGPRRQGAHRASSPPI